MKTKTELWAVPNGDLKIHGKLARPYQLRNTKSVRGLKAWMQLLKFRHGNTVAGIQKLNAETGEQIAFYPIT